MTDLITLAHDQTYPCGALYVLATPIGNVADISVRALHVLTLADVVACEDTRNTVHLLGRYGLSKALMAVHEHNELDAVHGMLVRLKKGERVVLVSDAGTPAVSDPGMRLVAAVREAGFAVIPLPGASAVVTALSIAGSVLLPSEGRFSFLGFLPNKAKQRERMLVEALETGLALVMFEAPHRITETVSVLAELAGTRHLLIARELTKRFEQTVVLPAVQAPQWLSEDVYRHQGEFVLVLAGIVQQDYANHDVEMKKLHQLLNALREQHISAKSQIQIALAMVSLPKAKIKEVVYAQLNESISGID